MVFSKLTTDFKFIENKNWCNVSTFIHVLYLKTNLRYLEFTLSTTLYFCCNTIQKEVLYFFLHYIWEL